MTHGGEDEGQSGVGDPGCHLLAAEGLLDASGELEEEDVLDRVAVKESARRLPLKGLEEPGLRDRMQESGGLPEGEGAQRGGGRPLEFLEEGVGGAVVDLSRVGGGGNPASYSTLWSVSTWSR